MVKFIHCADVHLLTPYRTRLTYERAEKRQQEALQAFKDMLKYAKEQGVSFVLITGDLFDGDNLDLFNMDAASKLFAQYPKIEFFIVCGNYDPFSDDCPYEMFRFPKNVFVFKSRWDKHVRKGYAISGFSLYDGDKKALFDGYAAQSNSVNIVCMHGLIPGIPSPLEYNVIDLKTMKGKKIDYLALGHVHFHNEGVIEGVRYGYPGVLESRDFTDKESGFILGTIDNGEIKTEFIKKEIRRHRTINVSFPPLTQKKEQLEAITAALKDIEPESLVKLVLTGEVDINNLYGEKWLLQEFKNRFFYLEIDNSGITLSKKWLDDLSPATLAGSFYQAAAQNTQLNENERQKILQYGLEALNTGEAAE